MTVSATLPELSRRATVDKTNLSKYSIKSWLSTVRKLYEQGDFEYLQNNIQDAFVHYMKGCSIMVEVIAKHQNYKDVKRDPTYIQLKDRTNVDILQRLEKITTELQEIDANNHKDDSLEETMTKYPTVSDIDALDNQTQSSFLLDDLPSVPTHAPLKNSQKRTAPLPPSPPMHIKMPEPQPMPAPIPVEKKGFQLPSPTGYPFPSYPVVEASELSDWIAKRNASRSSILILDVRPRDISERGCIKHRYIAQIEPLVLKQDVTSKRIEESMMMNREPEQLMFEGRNQFDLVVYYDQNSQLLQNDLHNPLYNLRAAIFEMEFQKTLVRAPMMLVGGFDAWKAEVGERGIHKYDENADESVNLTPVQHHKTMYDLFGDSWSSGSKESMSRYTNKSEGTPPLRGIFSNSLNDSSSSYLPTFPMPIPQPFESKKTQNIKPFTTKYPDIRPNASKLSRKNTFIDNPFHNFTKTSNTKFDVPPLPPKHARPSPSMPSAPPLPPKPSDIYNSRVSSPPAKNRLAPVSDNSFSQMGVGNGTTGLKNLGNTCFMNSIIQCLSGTIPFARYFLSGSYKRHINKENHLGTGGVVAEEFTSLLRTMWGAHYNFISPVLFREALIKFAPQFKGSEQHDSQEFLNFLLDGLHEDCNLIKKRPTCPPETEEEEAWFEQLPDWKASGIAWEKYMLRNSSVVVSLFQGQYKSQLKCLTCHATSTTYNTFMSLSLPIPANSNGPSSVSLYQCLDYFVKEEILEKDDAWKCPKCKALRKASKSLTISRLPDVLLIHLKRFSYDGPFKNKLETIVDSPMTGLDLSRYVPRTMFSPNQPVEKSTFCYDLYAVSNHFGSLTGGHYTACVRNGYRNEWHNFDDSRFSVCDQSKVLTRAAYNLFYVRSTVK